MMLGLGYKSHFEHILNDFSENGPNSTEIYKFFEAKIIDFNFFSKLEQKNFQF